MALFKMSMCRGIEKALTACQMAFGCLVERRENTAFIVAFSAEDAEVIKDTLKDVGSNYQGVWNLI